MNRRTLLGRTAALAVVAAMAPLFPTLPLPTKAPSAMALPQTWRWLRAKLVVSQPVIGPVMLAVMEMDQHVGDGFTKRFTHVSLNGHQFAVGPDPVEHGGITVTWQGSDDNREWYDL